MNNPNTIADKEDRARSIKKKSPRCPTLSLADGIERAQKVYDKEGLHEAPSDVVAQNMGYASSRSGAAAQTLASMAYFGLLVRPADGKMAVSKDVQEYKFTPNETDKLRLLHQWLRTPPMYAELLDRYATGLPSEANLKYEFIQRGFNSKVVEDYVAVFIESVDFAKYYEAESPTSENHPNPDEFSNPTINKYIPVQRTVSNQGIIQNVMSESDSIPIRLPGGRKAVLIIPSPFYESDKKIIKSHIDIIYSEEESEDRME